MRRWKCRERGREGRGRRSLQIEKGEGEYTTRETQNCQRSGTTAPWEGTAGKVVGAERGLQYVLTPLGNLPGAAAQGTPRGRKSGHGLLVRPGTIHLKWPLKRTDKHQSRCLGQISASSAKPFIVKITSWLAVLHSRRICQAEDNSPRALFPDYLAPYSQILLRLGLAVTFQPFTLK